MSQNTLQDMGHAIDVVWYALWYREEATLFINSGAKWTHGWYVVKDKVGWGLKFMLDFSPQKFLIGLEKRILELLS